MCNFLTILSVITVPYRLLGLIDLVRPEVNLQKQFKTAAIPVETIKAVDENHLIAESVYRPAFRNSVVGTSQTTRTSLGSGCA